MTFYYKLLLQDNTGPYSGLAWPLPNGGPGSWMPLIAGTLSDGSVDPPNGYFLLGDGILGQLLMQDALNQKLYTAEPDPAVVGDLVEGERGVQGNGYYICKLWQLPWWDRVGHRVFVCEPSEETIDFYKHSVCRRAELMSEVTWDDRRRRLFCANIADELMADYEVTYNDGAVELAVEAARLFANGEITTSELATARTTAETAALAAWRGERVAHPESEAWFAGLARAAAFACWNPSNPPSQFMVGATIFASGFRPYSREMWELFKNFSWLDADIESAWQMQELAYWMQF